MAASGLRLALRRLYRGETRFDFIGTRRRWYAASAVLVLICILSFVFRGFNFGVEFRGGTQFQIPVASTSITTTETERAFTNAGVAPADAARQVGSGSSRQIVVKTQSLDPGAQDTLETKVASELKIDKASITATTVSSSWGHDVTVKAIEGLIVFLIVVSIYISIRFQWRMAVGGIVALLHDLIIAAGVYSLVGFEVTPSTVVGLLTILGFSLYDTVVVYDKVAENSRDLLAGSRMTFSEAANLAVNQTLMRSINTSLIALLPVAGLLFVGAGLLGVGTIKDLALILFVGLASGAYSSLFLATPIVVDLTEGQPAYRQLTKRVLAKRAAEAARAQSPVELAGAGAGTARGGGAAGPVRRSGGPAPAPKPGSRPQRPRRN
jgi:preprotein translocase subunit SecF